ncbi:MAG: TetR/AcrR family transcriptional regulator [Pyrinomonadaceae bacterium]|nr:TetR/AcrR family transcriptional regulator [Pyrinomonadaceae bacterium]
MPTKPPTPAKPALKARRGQGGRSTPAAKARQEQGDRSRQAILEAAVHLASAEGLEGLTIGRLAAETKMSKSGLFAHFGSKEELQLATIEAARSIFITNVILPALKAEQGLPRLRKLCELWLDYANRKIFRGGCFFTAASAEFDSRPGPVRDRIAEIMKEWLAGLTRTVVEAQEAKQLDGKLDPAQLVFEINALEMGANWSFQLHGDKQAFGRARLAIFERLRGYSKPGGSAMLPAKRRSGQEFTQRRKGGTV